MAPEKWPVAAQPWLEMVANVVTRRSLGGRVDRDSLISTFNAHESAVKASVQPDMLLVCEGKEELFELVKAATQA